MEEWSISEWGQDTSVNKDTNDSGVEETQDKAIKIFNQKILQVIEKIEEIKLPEKNEQLRLITKRTFNSAAFLKYISTKEVIEEAIFVIYSINHEAAVMINDLIKEGRIKKAIILMSNLRNKAHRKKEQLTRDLFVDNKDIDLFFVSSHAKVMSLKTENNYYTVEGSGNMSYNSRVEQYIIDNSEIIYNFTKEWVLELKEYLKGKKEYIQT